MKFFKYVGYIILGLVWAVFYLFSINCMVMCSEFLHKEPYMFLINLIKVDLEPSLDYLVRSGLLFLTGTVSLYTYMIAILVLGILSFMKFKLHTRIISHILLAITLSAPIALYILI